LETSIPAKTSVGVDIEVPPCILIVPALVRYGLQ
jgi:hypothetical protein